MPLHIFRAGTYTDMHGREVTITPEELAAAAAAYDPATHQAPIVVGHPKDNSPAFGWLAALTATGEDLEGEPIELDADFIAAVRAGRYKTRSASFWPPAHPDNPKPGTWYLRHVGFLGGAAPAVKGLRGADLAGEDADTVTVECSAEPPPETHDMPETDTAAVDLAEREAALTAQAAELAAREAAVAEREAAAAAQAAAIRRTECAHFAANLVAEGRVLPADEAALTALLFDPAGEPSADFAAPGEDTPQAPLAWLREWLARLPKQVDFAERSAPPPAEEPAAVDPDARYRAEYARSAALQAEFSAPETYIAYRRAEESGRVAISNRLTLSE